MQVFHGLSNIQVTVPDTTPKDQLAQLKDLPNIKALVLCRTDGPVVCPDGLLEEALPSMTALATLKWEKNPSVPELEVMRQLPYLKSLELLSCRRWCGCEVNALAQLTGLTLLSADFPETDITPLLQLSCLEELEVRGAHVPRSLLSRVLMQFPHLKDLAWNVDYASRLDPDDEDEVVPVGRGTTIVRHLTCLICIPLDRQAWDPLQSFEFPSLQHFGGDELNILDKEPADMDDSLSWFPRMCRSAPGLTSLYMRLCPNEHPERLVNVGTGLALLTRLESLQLTCRARDDSFPLPCRYMSAQPLAGLTRLTRIWVEGVVNPQFFDTEVRALSGLKELRELTLCEKAFLIPQLHAPSTQDSLVTQEAVEGLRAALPNLEQFAVMGGWLDLARPCWAGSRVTPQGLLVVESPTWSTEIEDVDDDDELSEMQMFFGELFYGEWLIVDVL